MAYKDYKNIKVRTLALDLSANNVGFCVGDTHIDNNNKVVFNPLHIFQEHTKIKYSDTSYNNYDLGLTAENIYRLVRQVMKRFDIKMVVSEIPVGRRNYGEFKKTIEYIINQDNPLEELDMAFNTQKIERYNPDSMIDKGVISEELMRKDWSSTTLGLAISIVYIVSIYTPTRHPMTMHPLDIKEATGLKNYRSLKKRDMVERAVEQFPELNYIRYSNGELDIDANEHMVDALYCGVALELEKSDRKARMFMRNTIDEIPSKFAQLDRTFREVKFSDIDDVLSKHNIVA